MVGKGKAFKWVSDQQGAARKPARAMGYSPTPSALAICAAEPCKALD
jgi:hypothetical protein